jgi:hypothetical protein
MKHNVANEQRNKTWRTLLFIAVPAFFVLTSFSGAGTTVAPSVKASAVTDEVSAPQTAPRRPWTAVGSTGAVDEASLKDYAFGVADIGFRSGATGSLVVARYNVTNTFDNNANPNKPGWRTLEMGSTTPNSTIIEAKLFTIKACGTEPVLLCTARNRSSDHPCATCDIGATIDFTDSLYFVEVTLNRFNSTTANPRMFTLRLY